MLGGVGIVCIGRFGSESLSSKCLGLYAGIAFRKTSPQEIKSYWKPAGLGCKVLLSLLQSEPRLSCGGFQGTGASCSPLRQTWLLPNLSKGALCRGLTPPDVEGCTHLLQEGLLGGKGFCKAAVKHTLLHIRIVSEQQTDVTWLSWN